MKPNGYYRYPTIHKNNVVFVCEDDLWAVPAKGGVARRLTANLGMVSHPALSPDGEWLAFIGREEGEGEVYVMPAAGGPATRLTYLGSLTIVLGWTPDSQKIVFASNAGQPFAHLTPVYTISPSGGQPELLPYGPARSVSFGPAGGVVIGRRTNELANWKRYRGGTAGEIWLDSKGRGKFKPLLKTLSHVISPIWLGERIYFLSDHEGIGNLYSCTLDGKDIQRHTDHEDYYVRNPASDGRRIVYRAGADLFVFDPAKSGKRNPEKIKIEFHSPRVQRNRKFVKASSFMDHYALHPQGHSVAITTRGQAFALSNWEGAVLPYSQASGVRYRLAEWLNDGQRLVMLSDADGEEAIEIHADASKAPADRQVERLTGLDTGRPLFFKVSPKKDCLVFGNHRYELIWVDLEKKSFKVLDKSSYGRIYGLDWSPDGEWVVYSLRTSLHTAAIKLCHVESGATHFVTTPNNLLDFGPSFDPSGKYIYFLSFRDFDPVHDSYYFDLNFPRGARPYLVTLQKELPNPFIPLPGEAPGDNGKVAGNGKKDENGKTAPPPAKDNKESETTPPKPEEKDKPLQIDLDGIQSRVTAFPVPEGRYHQIRGINKDKVLFTSFPVEGSLGKSWRNQDEEEGHGALEMYDLVERKKEFIVNGISDFGVSQDRNYLIYRNGKHLRVLKAGEKPDNGAAGYTKKSGWIDLSRVRVAVNPPEEWQQMFREAWRLQRDHFWTDDMSRVDWQQVYQRYFPLIDRVTTRSEFSDLMWEMQGELGTSHAYEFGGDYRPAPRYDQGFLGADFEYDPAADGYRITHIIEGDAWVERWDSPLRRLGVNAQVGDVLLAIDGQRLSRELSPQQLLVNRANTEVQLTLLARPTTDHRPPTADGRPPTAPEQDDNQPENVASQPPNPSNPPSSQPSNTLRVVLVKTLRSEIEARYREWVEANRRRVHQETGERVGYVHIPNMGAFGYAEFHRYYLGESEREGLIVDVRFNGGGNVSQLLLEKLARRRIGYNQSRYGVASPYPGHSVLGPLVALTNEFAGSDGDIFTHAFKVMGLGPVIGKRTWGGVIGIWPRHSLVDGTITTQPEFSYWFADVGWGVENYGTDPDIEVDVRPQDYAAGQDPQLERGLQEIMKLMETKPPRIPDFGPRPSRALPKLPKLKKGK
ncbi:MAG: PDZ domain-containing protein [Anaerolineae bacterium]|nr:PDZ domain-containing protein [Anaerolineae bacterium]